MAQRFTLIAEEFRNSIQFWTRTLLGISSFNLLQTIFNFIPLCAKATTHEHTPPPTPAHTYSHKCISLLLIVVVVSANKKQTFSISRDMPHDISSRTYINAHKHIRTHTHNYQYLYTYTTTYLRWHVYAIQFELENLSKIKWTIVCNSLPFVSNNNNNMQTNEVKDVTCYTRFIDCMIA